MDSRSCPQSGAKQSLGELGDLYYLGRLGRLVRSCRSTPQGQVDGRRSRHGAQLYEYTIQLRDASRVPGDQSLLEARNFQSISLACEPGEVLRNGVWSEAIERKR